MILPLIIFDCTTCSAMLLIIKGLVNCQHKLDKGVPRMQQWPLDIPQ